MRHWVIKLFFSLVMFLSLTCVASSVHSDTTYSCKITSSSKYKIGRLSFHVPGNIIITTQGRKIKKLQAGKGSLQTIAPYSETTPYYVEKASQNLLRFYYKSKNPRNLDKLSKTTFIINKKKLHIIYNTDYWAGGNFRALGTCLKNSKSTIKATKTSSCLNNAKLCSNEMVCNFAVTKSSVGTFWQGERTIYQKHVKEAKSRGLNCNVKKIILVNKKTCENSINHCTNNQLCAKATRILSGKKVWDNTYPYVNYVKKAKSKGLQCNVARSESDKAKTCQSHPEICSITELCQRATYTSSNQTFWYTVSNRTKFVKEAKRRHYTCGVKIVTASSSAKTTDKSKTCEDDPTLCTVAQLCSKASLQSGEKKAWRKDYSAKKYVTEAKNNGVPCGVKIEVTKPKKEELLPAASGSGFFVSNEGHIVTNEHVIEGCELVKVHQLSEVYNSKVLTFDRFNDLALLKINKNPEVVFSLTDQPPFLNQDITTAGYPLVSDLGTNLKVTRGVVSSLTAVNEVTRFQMDAAVQPGNSGGPIFDDKGNILGVVVSRLINKKAQNVNFGIKAATVRILLNSNNVNLLPPNEEAIDKRKFSELMQKGTVLLSCWMTLAEIEKAQKKDTGKVFFKEFQK